MSVSPPACLSVFYTDHLHSRGGGEERREEKRRGEERREGERRGEKGRGGEGGFKHD